MIENRFEVAFSGPVAAADTQAPSESRPVEKLADEAEISSAL
jgi:hypothetical protein